MIRYETVYFDIRGRNEPIRLALALAGVAFTDTGVKGLDWPTLKPQTPLGQLPYLIERDALGERHIPQSSAILRHLGRVHGLYGRTEDEHTLVDIVIETALDAQAVFSPLLFGPHRGKDPAALARHFHETAPFHFERLSRILEAGVGGYFVADQPTIGDMVAFNVLDAHLVVHPGCLEKYPALAAFHAKVQENPRIAAYLAQRRPSEISALAAVLATGQPLS